MYEKPSWFSWGWKKKKIQNCQIKKTEIFKTTNSQYFLPKFQGFFLGWVLSRINQFILLTQGPIPEIYGNFFLRIGGFENLSFFESAILDFFFASSPMKISQSLLSRKDWSKCWWLPWFPAQNNSCVNICNTV